jgi:hypothetical protein
MMMNALPEKMSEWSRSRGVCGGREARGPHDAGSASFSTRGKRLRIRMRRLRCSGFAGHLCIHHVDF